jgi:general secretion pathway protein I
VSARQPGRGDDGFTLLETLVALAILGVVMSTVYGVIGSGLRSAHRDEDRLLLGLVAQNLLVRSRLDLDPAGGSLSGDIGGGLRWRIESEPYEVPDDILPEAPPGLDEPLLQPRQNEGDESATAGVGLGTRAANAGESEGLTSSDRGASDRTAAQDGLSADGGATDRQEPKELLRLRLIRVVVEKGEERFALSTLAMEAPLERPGRR